MTTKLSDYKFGCGEPISLLLLGATGTGKSIAACSCPKPIYVANFDDRMGSVKSYYEARPELGVNTSQIDFDIFPELGAFIDKLEALENNCPYRTLIIDPLTKLCNKVISYSIGQRKGKGRKHIGKIIFSTLEDYGAEISVYRQLMDSLQIIKNQQKVNIILTAHLVTVTYNSASKIKTEDGTTISEQKSEHLIVTEGRKLAPQIPLTFDEVYHFYVESSFGNLEYKIKTYNDGDVIARTSFANVPGEIEWKNENFYRIMSPYYGVKKSEEEIQQDKLGDQTNEINESF